MPVVSRRPNKQQGPSGLDKFLQTIGVVAGIGNQVGNFVQNRQQMGIQREQLGIQEEQAALQVGQEADRDAQRVFEMGMNRLITSRNTNLLTAATQGAAPDPSLLFAAPVLGDEPDPVQRQALRESIAQLLGMKPSEIGDKFILSPTTLMSEAKRDVGALVEDMRNNLRLGAHATDPQGLAVAAKRGETGIMAQMPGASAGGLVRDEALENQANELFRVEINQETGEATLDGAVFNNPMPAMNQVLTLLDRPTLMSEFDPAQFGLSGPNRVVSGPVFEELMKNGFNALWQDDNAAAQTERDSAQLIVDKFGMDYKNALHAVRGEYDQMTEGNPRLFEQFQNMSRSMVEFLGQQDPMTRQMIQTGIVMAQEWNLPADQILGAMTAFGDYIQERNPGFPVPRNLGVFQRLMNSMFGGTGSGFKIEPGSILEPDAGAISTSTDLDSPAGRAARGGQPAPTGTTPEDAEMNMAWTATLNDISTTLRAIPDPAARRTAAQGYSGYSVVTDPTTGRQTPFFISQEIIDQILANLEPTP